MTLEELKPLERKQLTETRWVQNLRHPCYQLRQPIPVLVKKKDDVVTANYDDVELWGTGESVKAAILDLCAKIVAYYEELKASSDRFGAQWTQDYTFLKQMIEEIQSPAWEEVKQLYQEKLKEIPYVRRGYMKIDGNNADVFIIISEYSLDRIEELVGIDHELNMKFRPLYFVAHYELSEEYLELGDFERFYTEGGS